MWYFYLEPQDIKLTVLFIKSQALLHFYAIAMEGSTSEKHDSGFQIRHVYELQLLGFGPQSKKYY